MNKIQKLVNKTDTKNMSVDELKTFIKEELAPLMDEKWQEYEIYLDSDGNPVYAPYCDECGGLSDEKSATIELSEEVKGADDLEDIVTTDSVDYLSNMNYLDWCSCDDD